MAAFLNFVLTPKLGNCCTSFSEMFTARIGKETKALTRIPEGYRKQAPALIRSSISVVTGALAIVCIIEFDRKLNADSALISIGWAAGEFHTGIILNRALQQGLVRFPGVDPDDDHPPFQWDPKRFSFAEALVTICRWYQKLVPGDAEWLQGLRR